MFPSLAKNTLLIICNEARDKKKKGVTSTAEGMVNWLREEISDQKTRFRYKILFHVENDGPSIHTKPKGK